MKGEGGAIVIPDDENALLKWMVAGPRISSLIEEFEKSSLANAKEMINVSTEQGNPFGKTDLASIRNSILIPRVEAVKCVTEAFTVELKQYDENVVSCHDQVPNSIHEIIPRTNNHIFA
ncbi:hypothetical protein JTB14_027020 [Gonioctena quinquepunctata]|nr:hypothetical protein JTB14_027020 [Gonioctena quinquepunctata]